ncbi:Small ubiquitin- modifier 1 [Serendipita sp. 396]|nr:Small ubiquitin- modifier 1 [Serendipita sp. 396]KAG8789067.1 Small ubiquitin- modifier 1 [Serendipita sp. 397]KAG8827636.1 Small ubiquitin- modifier 1 [Serendipita sp. 401]KAG8839649.1 Small ubiquitin- modifier 1 [Serendipita sp. 400]KAG8861000.1 Small ubiquitin- modifier 1 [Serendipita sp. 411]KAG8877009.1 Small ubiquitin- modifier 1 [Serendipita sp. 405]
MSEERDVKPNINDEELEGEATQGTMDPVTPVKPKGQKINLTVTGPGGQSVKFAIKPSSTFEKLFKAAADRFNVQLSLVRFLYDGQRLRPDQTPEEFDMVDDDQIDIQLQQTGGFAPFSLNCGR